MTQPALNIDHWTCDDEEFMPCCEITVTFNDGSQRWCIMATPEHLAACGDLYRGKQSVYWHPPCAHLFVLSHISADVVEHVLQTTFHHGQLLQSTLALPTCPPRILYVEDHHVFANNVMNVLLNTYDIDWVENVEDAKNLWRQELGDYELILCDYDLPDGKGSEVVRWVRNQNTDVCIIAASAHDEGNQKLMEAGATIVCSKMNIPGELMAMIDRLLS